MTNPRFGYFERLRFLAYRPPRRIVVSVLLVFVVIGSFLVASSRARPATSWMLVFHPSDFPDFSSLVHYLQELRVPIPPIISTAEIVNYMIAGDTSLVTVALYRFALVASFVIAIVLSSTHVWRMAVSFVLSIVFLWCTVVIHAGNPQLYDILYPFFVLSFILLLRCARHSRFKKAPYIFAITSGFFLSMAELTRPFVFVLLPVVLLLSYFSLRRLQKRYFYAFLIPIVLFSGVWHCHVAIRHGQVTWTNHGGFNLARAWPQATSVSQTVGRRTLSKRMPLAPEPNNAPLKEGRWANLNTEEHFQNSKTLQKAVLDYVMANPRESVSHIERRIYSVLFGAPTKINQHEPQDKILSLYRPLVRLCVMWMLVASCFLGINLLFSHGQRLEVMGAPQYILLCIAVMSICTMSIGENDKEEARYLISILPLLATLPTLATHTYRFAKRASMGKEI